VAYEAVVWLRDPAISLPVLLAFGVAFLAFSALSGYVFWFFNGVANANTD
jgi:hypothetical protein